MLSGFLVTFDMTTDYYILEMASSQKRRHLTARRAVLVVMGARRIVCLLSKFKAWVIMFGTLAAIWIVAGVIHTWQDAHRAG
jgi:hypothetical protein